jgi:hypothetical protein
MTHLNYILTAWIVSAVAIALYSARVVQRGRRLARSVPAARRRWMTTTNDPGPPR